MGVRRATAVLGRYEPVAIVGGLWLVAKLLRYTFPALFPTLREAPAFSATLLGAAYTVMMLLYALMQFPSGALADTVEDVRVVAAGALVAALGGGLFLLPASVPVLVAGMLLVGVGTGVHKTVSVSLLSRLYPERTGRALGTFDTLGTAGGVVAPLLVVAALSSVGWPWLLVATGLAGALLTVALALRVPRGDAPTVGLASAVRATDVRSYLPPFRRPRFLLFVAVTLCFAFAYNGVVAFLPLYLVESGLAAATASGLYSLLFAVSVVQVVSGDLADRLGTLRTSTLSLAVATVGLAGLVVGAGDGRLVLGGAVVLLGVGSHGFRPVRGAYLAASFPDEVRGGGVGIARTLLMGVGAVSPTVVGAVADAVGYREAFLALAAAMAGGVVCAAAMVATE
ncbi:MFS transporter [Halosegnis marinus]|uniref:MFS transporter n=1 Tax=Halosegnis marinus TaxID=3034023 RepID=A0ABD5ZRE7_9EURY|nr:MFS transporter [Halosegnis sp. DT85]